jgi:hypothetical protein
MPIHDWSRDSAGIFHDFHHDWTIEIRRTQNRGILPPGYYAMADQRVSGPEADIIALQLPGPEPSGGLLVAETPPRIKEAARFPTEAALYARRANRIAIHSQSFAVIASVSSFLLAGSATRAGVQINSQSFGHAIGPVRRPEGAPTSERLSDAR